MKSTTVEALHSTGDFTAEQWAGYQYPATVTPIRTEDGDGWLAVAPLLFHFDCSVIGTSQQDAIEKLEVKRLALYPMVKKSGCIIPVLLPLSGLNVVPLQWEEASDGMAYPILRSGDWMVIPPEPNCSMYYNVYLGDNDNDAVYRSFELEGVQDFCARQDALRQLLNA